MTFSEFMRLLGWKYYLQYCIENRIKPIKDIDTVVEKPCALLDKNFFTQQQRNKNA